MTKIIQGNVCLKNSVLALVPKQNEGQGHFKITLQQYRIRFAFFYSFTIPPATRFVCKSYIINL